MYVRPRRSKSAEGRSWGVARGMSTLRVDAGGARGLSTLHVRAAVALEKKSWGGKQKTGGGRRAARAGRPPGLLYKDGRTGTRARCVGLVGRLRAAVRR